MDPLATPADAATAHRTGVSFSSIGVEVEEPVFLDEADGHGIAPQNADRPSPFDLFADEDDLPPRLLAPPAAPILVSRPATVAAAVRKAPPAQAKAKPATRPAPRKPAVAEPDMFKTHTGSNAGRVSLIAVFVLVAAATMFLTVQACQVAGTPPVASVAPVEP